MKPRLAKQRLRALTFIDLLAVVAMLIILALILLPLLAHSNRAPRINCVSNLKQISLAFRIWEGDNNNQYPMAVSSSIGGGKEFITAGNVAACLRVISNELSTTKILICPVDHDRTYASNFDVLDVSHISYFIGVDATNGDNPRMLLTGDDNFAIGGVPVTSGLLQVSVNSQIVWGSGRHGDIPRHFWTAPPRNFDGNFGFADGRVNEESDSGLQQALQNTGLATNRFAIP